MDQLLEAAMSNLHDMINEGARNEIANLKKTILYQEKVIRKARYQLATIRIEAQKGTDVLESTMAYDLSNLKKFETPNPKPSKDDPNALPKWLVIYDWSDWSVGDHDRFANGGTMNDWLKFGLLLFAVLSTSWLN